MAVFLSPMLPFLIPRGPVPAGMVFLAIVYLGILVGLRRKSVKRGLAWAVTSERSVWENRARSESNQSP